VQKNWQEKTRSKGGSGGGGRRGEAEGKAKRYHEAGRQLWIMYFNTSMEWNPAVEAAPISTRTEHPSFLEATSFIRNVRTRLYVVLEDLLNSVLILVLWF